MRLTVHTDYALRVLMYLALHRERLVTIREIARAYGISEHHLTKVVQGAGRLGWVETVRGRGGGLRLARLPAEISVGEVVRATEEELGLVECMQIPAGKCALTSACVLQSALSEAMAAFMAVLDSCTLADLVAPRERLLRRLDQR